MAEELGGQPPFVGESRRKVVEGLAGLLTRAQLDERPVWVSIEAPSGWGKTRVAHAFYEHLAAHQSRRYWPPTILEATDASFFDVASRRKRVFPEPARFDREPNALPEFFWWGIACDLRSGAPSQILIQDLAQIEAHALFLEAAWASLASLGERHGLTLAEAREIGFKIAEEAAGEGFGKVAENLIGSAVPGLGLVLDLAKFGLGKAKEGWDRRRTIEQSGALPAGEGLDPAAQAAETLIRTARPGLPVIVFVEDLHRDTGLVAALIGQLLASDAPVMILTTTWPGEVESSSDLSQLLGDPVLADRIVRLRHDLPLPSLFPEGASMDALPLDARKALIRAYFPATAEPVLAALAARYNNPLPIELVCTLDRHRRAGHDGALHLSPDEIETLPRKVEQLYRELWSELPYPVQCVLALSTLAIPMSDAAWHRRLVEIAIEAVADRIHSPAAADPVNGVVPHGWVREVDSWLRRFNEPDQMRIARQDVEDRELFGDDVIEDFLAALVDVVTEAPFVLHGAAGAEDLHRAWLALSLHNGRRVDDDIALDAILLLLGTLSDGPGDIRLKLTLAPILAGLSVQIGDERMLDARLSMALSLASGAGRVDEAIVMLDALLADRRALHGDDHPATESAASELINWLFFWGQNERAVAVRRELVDSKRQRLGEEDPKTVEASAMLANHLFLTGQTDEAVALFSATLPRLQALFGKDHESVVSARNQLALAQAQHARTDATATWRRGASEAVAMHDALIGDLAQIHGPVSHEVLLQRVRRIESLAGEAAVLAQSGELDSAISAAGALIDDIRRFEASNQALIDRTRRSLSKMLWESDRLFEFVEAQAARLQALENDPPVDIGVFWNAVEDNIFWLEDAALLEESLVDKAIMRDAAVALREALIESQAVVIGEEDYRVVAGKLELIRSLIAAGRIEEARSLHREFLDSPFRAVRLGWQDLSVPRQMAGREFREAGLAGEEVAALAALIADAEACPETDIGKVQGLRHELALTLAATGEHASAVGLLRSLLTEQTEAYGSTHPMVAATLATLAEELCAGGDKAAAIALWQSLIEDLRTELGADHAQVGNAENALAQLLARTRH